MVGGESRPCCYSALNPSPMEVTMAQAWSGSLGVSVGSAFISWLIRLWYIGLWPGTLRSLTICIRRGAFGLVHLIPILGDAEFSGLQG
jgi:hypothetical protein